MAITKTQQQFVYTSGNTIAPGTSLIDGVQGNIVQLGIQAPVGTKFKINNQDIIIGYSGIYELNYKGLIIETVTYNGASGSTLPGPTYIDIVVEREVG